MQCNSISNYILDLITNLTLPRKLINVYGKEKLNKRKRKNTWKKKKARDGLKKGGRTINCQTFFFFFTVVARKPSLQRIRISYYLVPVT